MVRTTAAGRNLPCPCGSGKKFKKCCERKAERHRVATGLVILVFALVIGGVIAGVVSFQETSYATGGTGRVWSPEHQHYH